MLFTRSGNPITRVVLLDEIEGTAKVEIADTPFARRTATLPLAYIVADGGKPELSRKAERVISARKSD